MMGSTHALTGAVAGVAVAPLLGFGPGMTVASGVICAGAALIPDLDHTNSTATLAHGVVTKAISGDLRDLSEFCWRKTATDYDRMSAEHSHDRKGTHRYLTHTVIFAVTAGIFLGVVSAIYQLRVLITAVMISFAIRGFCQMRPNRRLDQWLPRTVIGIVLAYMIPITGWQLGFLIMLGCLVHDLGDGMTKQGVPYLWPIKVRGMYWRRFKTPITASTGNGWFEPALRYVSIGAAPIILLMYNHADIAITAQTIAQR